MRRRVLILVALAGLLVAAIGFPASAGAALGNPRTGVLVANTDVGPNAAFAVGPTVHLSVGTWLLMGNIEATGGPIDCRLTDGTSFVARSYNPAANVSLSGFIVEAAPADIWIECASGNLFNGAMYGLAADGAPRSWVTAVKVN